MADSELYDCRGDKIYVSSTTRSDEGVIRGVSAVCEKAQRFRYREVTLQDWKKGCICCQHAKGDLNDNDYTLYYCAFMKKGISLTELAFNVIGQQGVNQVSPWEGTCDAYLADNDVIKALEIWRNSDKHRDQDVRQAVEVLREHGRHYRY